MKIIFFGTSGFAVPSLRAIIRSDHELCAVVTQPDRKSGRKLVLTPPPVKVELQKTDIPIHQPEKASSAEMVALLKKHGADLFVVVEFGQILKKELLAVPKKLCVNLHASLLPKYRGAAPINWAIINGETRTGVTTIKMNERMDEGDIIEQKNTEVLDADTSETLKKRLSDIGAALLMETIDLIDKGSVRFTKQDNRKATSAPLLKKADGHIDWSIAACYIHNRVRGLIPWPSAYTCLDGKILKIWKSSCNIKKVAKKDIGRVLRLDTAITVGTGSGELKIEELQLEGGKRLDAATFLRGHKLLPNTRFE